MSPEIKSYAHFLSSVTTKCIHFTMYDIVVCLKVILSFFYHCLLLTYLARHDLNHGPPRASAVGGDVHSVDVLLLFC